MTLLVFFNIGQQACVKLEVAASSYSTHNYYICKTVLRRLFSLAYWMSSHCCQPPSPYSTGPELLPIPQCSGLFLQMDTQTSFLRPSIFPRLEAKGYTKATADTGMEAEAQWSWTTHSGPSRSTRWVS